MDFCGMYIFVFWLDVSEVIFFEVVDSEVSEDVVEYAEGVFDGFVSSDGSAGFESGEGEGFDEFVERHAIL